MRAIIQHCIAFFITVLWLQGLPPAAAAEWVPAGGNVYFGDTPLCALVLINGQSQFSCDGSGRFDMDVPLDGEGLVTLQAFADGFAPANQVLTPERAAEYRINMLRVTNGLPLQVAVSYSNVAREGWGWVGGEIKAGTIPVCALVLANGQEMFSCDEDLGTFALEVPLDQDGNVTLMIFAAGFQPYRKIFYGPGQANTFSVSGSVVANVGSAADGDVNDPFAPYIPNDTFATAQEIPNPVNLGGYANQPEAGAPGPSLTPGDASDIYKISVVAGQRITLILGDSSFPNDLDLFLGDTDGNLIASSEGVGNAETIIAPYSGTHLIEVFAYDGASSYVLAVGQELLPNPAKTLSTLDEFIPGDAVVRFRDAGSVKLSTSNSLSSKSTATGLATKAGSLRREILFNLGNATQKKRAMRKLRIHAAEEKLLPMLMQNEEYDQKKIDTIRMIKALRWRSDVEYVDPNYILKPSLQPNDQYYPLQWHYPMINLPQAWDVTTGSNDVVVAVIDSGVILSHPDLQGRLIQGYDFIQDPESARDGDGIDDNPDDPGDLSNASGSSSFHGTHVAGTIGAATNNISGVAGVTWSTSIMPLRALGLSGKGTLYDVSQAVRYAAGLDNDSGTLPVRKADVINLSLGSSGFSQAIQDLFTEVRNQGIIVIAAAGNNNTNAPFYPASYNGVVSVSAVAINRDKASYSNYGPTIDVAAPGGDSRTPDINGDGFRDGVFSTIGDDSSGSLQVTLDFLEGTSMASPHVAGVAALMKAVDPALTPAIFDNLLIAGQLTNDLGPNGRDNIYGHGLIDAHKAVVAAGRLPVSPYLVANPSSLNFGTIVTSLTLTLENGGGGELSVNTPTVNAPWLTITQSNVGNNGSGTYTVSVDRSNLAENTYAATVTVTSSANTIYLPIIMQVSNVDVSADAGRQYILLIDPISGDTIDAVSANAINGRYSYSFTDVPNSTYQLISGSDSNNDGYICDAGESCGAYLILDQPSPIIVNTDLTLGDFQTGYITGLSANSSKSTGPVTGPYKRPDTTSRMDQRRR